MKIKLVKTKNPRRVPKTLRKKSREVKEISPDILGLINEMRDIMQKNKGVGISAIQVGVPLRIMVVESCQENFVLINPEIIKLGKEKIPFREGCLSFPGCYSQILRPEKVKLKAKNLEWKDIEIEADGLIGRCFQHEIDHMNGIVFIDHLKDLRDLEKEPEKKRKNE